MERYYFGKREQGKDESVEEYITNLRKPAASCKFGTLVDERIRDQFVLKCCSDKIREELWLKDEPPLEEVIIVAKRVEHMLKCVKELSGNKVVSGERTKVEEVVCESSACHLRGDRRERGVLETEKRLRTALTVARERMAGATENKEVNLN
ncbi:hypothetical protein NDU88_001511 [Pleurodeles waltl]|uniref:Retrotransposon gag domain-containing protein n=1 Tax=Pleurodeles waltl TaxID=8319 RepID=A0AAV7W0P8_PLEWA|nr:hypothetical protein NDU88_001511 [Pleurodeles waltl]